MLKHIVRIVSRAGDCFLTLICYSILCIILDPFYLNSYVDRYILVLDTTNLNKFKIMKRRKYLHGQNFAH
jgi:hypothetical protein